jgi:hypothetical protein
VAPALAAMKARRVNDGLSLLFIVCPRVRWRPCVDQDLAGASTSE